MIGVTNVGGTGTGFELTGAIVQIKSAVGSTVGFFDSQDNVIELLPASMGIIDNNSGLACYYCLIQPENFGTLIIKIAQNGTDIYSLEVNITSNKFYNYTSSDFVSV